MIADVRHSVDALTNSETLKISSTTNQTTAQEKRCPTMNISDKKYYIFISSIFHDLKQQGAKIDDRINGMTFYELPFRNVDEFDYPAIAEMVKKDGADIIWVALGAPKQEIFMSKLLPYLDRGVMIAVGAAFKFFSGVEAARAPQWMVKLHLEFVYRIFREPKKQIRRCWGIISTLPKLLIEEKKRKRKSYNDLK